MCSFTIPNYDENEIQPYFKYIQDVVASCLSYVRLTAAGAVEYHILTAPSSGDTQSDAIIIEGSAVADIVYQDIITEVRGENPHLPVNPLQTAPTELAVDAFYLHGVDQKTTFRHCLADISGRLDNILDLRSNRRIIYRFRNATELIDAALGDDVTLSFPIVAGGSGTVNLKIVTLEKSEDGITAEAMDLLGL